MAKVSRAWTWLKKRPAAVLLVVALVAAVAYVAYRTARRTEGWEFSGKNWNLQADDKEKERADLRRYCGEDNMTLAKLQENDGWSWVGDFSRSQVEKLCNWSDEQAKKIAQDPGSKCGNGPCKDPGLRGEKPCRSKDGSKCCVREFNDDTGRYTLRRCQKTKLASDNTPLWDSSGDMLSGAGGSGGQSKGLGSSCPSGEFFNQMVIWHNGKGVTGVKGVCSGGGIVEVGAPNWKNESNGSDKMVTFDKGLDAAYIYTGRPDDTTADSVVTGLNLGNQNTTKKWTGNVGSTTGTGKSWKCGGTKRIVGMTGAAGDYIDNIKFLCG